MARLLIISVLLILALYLAYKQGRLTLGSILKSVVCVIIGVLLGMSLRAF